MRESKAAKSRKLGAAVAAALLMLGLGVGPLVFNHFEKRSLEARIEAAERELGMDRGPAESLDELKHAVADLRDRLSGSQQYVPEAPELAGVLRGLTDALSGFAPSDQSIETQATRAYARYSVIPIFVRFEGDFLSTYGTLRSIERMPRMVRIDRLSIRRLKPDRPAPPGAMPRAEVDLELSTFYAPEQQEEAS